MQTLTFNKKLHINQPNAQTVSCARHSVFNNVCIWISKKNMSLQQLKQGRRKAWHIPSPKNLTWWPWSMTLKINRVPDSLKDCTKFGQNTLKGVDSRVFTRMLCGKNLTRWPWPLTLKINRVPNSPKDYVCTKFGQNPLKDVDSRVFTRMLSGKNLTQWHWPLTYDLENQ